MHNRKILSRVLISLGLAVLAFCFFGFTAVLSGPENGYLDRAEAYSYSAPDQNGNITVDLVTELVEEKLFDRIINYGAEQEMIRELANDAAKFGRVSLNEEVFSPGFLLAGDIINVAVFKDKSYRVTVEEAVAGKDSLLVKGRVEGSHFGYFHMSAVMGQAMAVLRVPEENKVYFLVYSNAGSYQIYEVNIDNIDRVEGELYYYDHLAENVYDHTDQELQITSEQTVLSGDPSETIIIDVMVVYTPAARNWAGSTEDIHNVINLAMAKAQQANDNSNTGIIMNLVHRAEVSYVESGSAGTDLDRLTENNDGYMDSVHDWRNQYGADLVALFADVNYGGTSWLKLGYTYDADYGFSITRVRQATNTYTHIHEMGHNMGAHHHKEQNFQPGPNTHLNTYSAGWRFQVGSTWYNTLMSYSDGSYFPPGSAGAGITSIEVGYFSSPLISFQGIPTGHAADGDNARTLRETKQSVSAYRDAVLYTLTVDSANPAAGIEINSSSGHGGITGYSEPVSLNMTVNLEAPLYYGSGEARKIFNGWSGSFSSSNRSVTFLMDGDKSLTANYLNDPEEPYTVAVYANPEEGGTVEGGGSYSSDASITISAEANEGYLFVNWSENGEEVSSSNSYSFTVTENRELTANFIAIADLNYDFTLLLKDGWNLLSLPRPGTIYYHKNHFEVSLSYKEGQWLSGQVEEELYNPSRALFMKANQATTIYIVWEEFTPGSEFAGQQLNPGWNLISSGMAADYRQLLASVTYDGTSGLTQLFAPNSYNERKGFGYHLPWSNQLVNLVWQPGESGEVIYPFDGYWVYLRGDALTYITPVGETMPEKVGE